jgi:long-chain acyl-CoA synthetase
MDGLTIPSMFEQSVQTYPDNVMMMEKRDGAYRNSTYREIHEQVLACAAGLIEYGIRKGDRIALISEGRNDWIIAELGILYAGAVNVPLSVKIDELSEIKFRLAHSGCRLAIVSRSQAPKVFQIKNDLADLEKIIVLDPIDRMNDDEMLFADLLERGQTYLQSNADSFAGIWQGIGPDDYANICYTSGTTADPKGIILTHRNYVVNVRQATALLPIPDWYTTLLILPWDHSFAHTAGLYTLMRNGGCIASVQSGKTAIETLRNIPVNIREVKPVFLLSVPALAKSFKKNIEAAIRGKGARVEKLFQKALETAYAYNGIGSDRGKDGERYINRCMPSTIRFYSGRYGRISGAGLSSSSAAAHCSILNCSGFSTRSASRCTRGTVCRKPPPLFPPTFRHNTGSVRPERWSSIWS